MTSLDYVNIVTITLYIGNIIISYFIAYLRNTTFFSWGVGYQSIPIIFHIRYYYDF